MNSPKSIKDIEKTLLKFGTTNAKLQGQGIATFSIPAGYTCPGACECLSRFDRLAKRIVDGSDTQFRCFTASLEASFRSVRDAADHNWDLIKRARTVEKMVEIIEDSLPRRGFKTIRVHVGGDFYNDTYFVAWMEVARRNPDRVFYAYTKSLPIWIKHRSLVPSNFILTASYGGKHDHLIKQEKLRYALVVFHPDEAKKLKLEIDHDDSHARDPKCKAFALLIHGTAPKGSKHAAAIKQLKEENIEFAYSRKK